MGNKWVWGLGPIFKVLRSSSHPPRLLSSQDGRRSSKKEKAMILVPKKAKEGRLEEEGGSLKWRSVQENPGWAAQPNRQT